MSLTLKATAEQFTSLINRLIPVNQQELIFDLIKHEPNQVSLENSIYQYLREDLNKQHSKELTDLIIKILYQNALRKYSNIC